MGLSSSKHSNAPTPLIQSSSEPATEPVVRRSRSSRITLLKSSCLRSNHSVNDDSLVSDCRTTDVAKAVPCSSKKCCRSGKAEENEGEKCVASSKELDDWAETSFADSVSRENSASTRALSSRNLNPHPSRFMSRVSFFPGNLSFRLPRSNSARPHTGTSTSYGTSNNEERGISTSSDLENRNDTPLGCDIFPALFSSSSVRTRHRCSASNNLGPSTSSPECSSNLQDNQQMNDAGGNFITDLFSPTNHNDGAGNRDGDRRLAAREYAERNVRFSRTLSVGRLRDRVLRRSPVPDSSLYGFEQEREGRNNSRVTRRRASGHATMQATTGIENLSQPRSYNDPSSISLPFYSSPNVVHENLRARETRYRDLLEHRSNFIERRRRIRSQVRALQRLGRRFQNHSGHERSCVLSNQHLTGHCTCRSVARDVNNGDDATARASISRIVMLAEALFEVLDEIHQQSVVMSSQPSLSSIGSIPAPNEVVDSLPLKIFSKIKKKATEEVAQCYICLVEYDEGDSIRTLPCHHQFHRACVDKWLKEIHRVCPLCRGDICRPEPSTEGC